MLLPLVFSRAETLKIGVELSRYAGVYTAPPYYRLTVTVAGDVLEGDAGNGQPSETLLPLRERGRFQLKRADFEIQFLEDKSGSVFGLEMIGGGKKRQMRRADDGTANAKASLRAVAVNAEASVNAKVFNGYKRSTGTDGKFRSETYVVGSGGFQSSGVVDSSAEKDAFEEIVRTLAPALAKQQYAPALSQEKADLVLIVYWGATASADHPAVIAEEMEDPTSHTFRRQLNRENARLMGFNEALQNASTNGALRSLAVQDVVKDLEASRYWVAVVALDFEELVQKKNVKALWSVRYSVRSRGTNFPKALPGMTELAAGYFGRDSNGLVNPNINRNEDTARVEMGELKILDEEPAPPPETGK
ncbi:MAG: hypothetical protein WDM96_08850 [Lacunisphaera sp.]